MRGALAVALLLLAGCATPAGQPVVTSAPAGGGATSACAATVPALDASWAAQKARVRFVTSLGDFVAEIETERAPATAQNFLGLARDGFYDGTLFHRVIRDFVVQGGDPLSRDDDPLNDGAGGPGYEIADEFHPALRHDAEGVLSMANAGPNSGGSQFFVTLGATPHLDDRHSVFGRVVEGIEVVRAIGAVETDEGDAPLEPVRLERIDELDPVAYPPTSGADVHVVVQKKRAEPERAVRFAVVMKNEGNVRDMLGLAASVPPGWTCAVGAPVVVPAGAARVAFLDVVPPTGAQGAASLTVGVVRASGAGVSGEGRATVEVSALGREVKDGDKVTANYAGLLPDGRLFDTSMETVGASEAQPKLETLGGWRSKPSYQPFPFTVGSGVIPGFTNLAKTAKAGETVTALIPARDAYATGNQYERPLTGRDLVFELEIVSIG